ncbi:DEAD-like helicase [Fusarium albosuccineum]|uniref:DEAD-like helicase n=1 Tax=Fusarium albosuccineum TaxID=1237068 RepID=A0A8H4LI47_9HYPO|nr:DEAD-like helicase [Fusarium albosuccineum]
MEGSQCDHNKATTDLDKATAGLESLRADAEMTRAIWRLLAESLWTIGPSINPRRWGVVGERIAKAFGFHGHRGTIVEYPVNTDTIPQSIGELWHINQKKPATWYILHKRDSHGGFLEARGLTKATSCYDDADDHEPAEEPDGDPDAKDAKAARSKFMTNEERADLLDPMATGYEADDSESCDLSDLSDRSDLSHLSDVEMPDAPEGSVQEYGADDSESDDGSEYENTSDQEMTDATDQLDEEGWHSVKAIMAVVTPHSSLVHGDLDKNIYME